MAVKCRQFQYDSTDAPADLGAAVEIETFWDAVTSVVSGSHMSNGGGD